MSKTYLIKDLHELDSFATQFLAELDTKAVLLNGEIGAGKTTFMHAVSRAFGVKEDISSPTFSIINTYTAAGKKIYHVDLYRIEDVYELEMTGFYDLFSDDGYIFIEWADKFDIKPGIKKYTTIDIKVSMNGERAFTVTKND